MQRWAGAFFSRRAFAICAIHKGPLHNGAIWCGAIRTLTDLTSLTAPMIIEGLNCVGGGAEGWLSILRTLAL